MNTYLKAKKQLATRERTILGAKDFQDCPEQLRTVSTVVLLYGCEIINQEVKTQIQNAMEGLLVVPSEGRHQVQQPQSQQEHQ